MSQHDGVTILCWQLTVETALEEMVLDVDELGVSDGINVLSSEDFYAHLSQVAGHHKGDPSGIWDRSRGNGAPEWTADEIKPITCVHGVPEALICPDSREGLLCSIGLLSCTICLTWARR